jgi:heme exporter protein C
VAIGLLIYLAYSLVRSSMPDEMQKARISSVYNIFAFVIFMILIWILPRMTDSLHPGNGGNPAFSKMDLDNRMRMVFYPAILGWTLLGYWIAQLRIRIKNIEQQNEL